MNRFSAFFAIFVFALALVCQVEAAENSFTETFSTTQYRDVANTTAWWDTISGTLSLYPDSLRIVDQYNSPGYAAGVAIVGEYAYLADDSYGIRVIDISDPASLTLIGSYNTTGNSRSVAISGDYAYVADGNNGMVVLDISNPATPSLVTTYSTFGYADDIAIAGDIVYIADTGAGLHIADIADPTSPVFIQYANTPGNAISVELEGDYAYVADDAYDIQIIDITYPSSPSFAATWNVSGTAKDIEISGDYAYVALEEGGLVIGDISNPLSPSTIGSYSTGGRGNAVCLAGSYCYYFHWLDGIKRFDVSDPANPVLAGQLDTPGVSNDGVVAGEYLLLADGNYGLYSVKAWNLMGITSLDNDLQYDTRKMEVRGKYLYITSNNALIVYDISDPYNLVDYGATGVSNSTDCSIDGNYAYMSSYNGLSVIDITDPTAPTVETTLATSDPGATSCLVAGDYAFVGHSSGIDVISMVDPLSPSLTATLSLSKPLTAMAISGDRVFTATDDDSVMVIDISDPTSPSRSGFYGHTRTVTEMEMYGDYLYCADSQGYLVLSISDPDVPTLVYRFSDLLTPEEVLSMDITGNLLFFSEEYGELNIHDISSPAAPVELYTTGSAGIQEIVLWGDLIFYQNEEVYNSYLYSAQIFNPFFDISNNVGQSTELPAISRDIYRYRISAPGSYGIINYSVSLDGGAHWNGLTSGGSWEASSYPGQDPIWWAKLYYARSQKDNSPFVDELELEFLYLEPFIEMVEDVPNDQGGQVRLRFARSAMDFSGESSQIELYTVWRRVDDGVTLVRLSSLETKVPELFTEDAASWGSTSYYAGEKFEFSREATAALEAFPVKQFDGRLFVKSNRDIQAAGFPEGYWEAVGSFGALQQDQYLYTAGTFADSSTTTPYTAFCVTAHSINPSNWWTSPVDSGYSVDNIAPGVPQGLAAAYNTGSGNELAWDPSPETDFQYYRVYRGSEADFEPSPENLVHETAAPEWTDPEYDGWDVYYKVTALDHAGNESEAASPSTVTDDDTPHAPAAFRLYQNAPNPFNPSTTIAFDLPEAAHVRLSIYNIKGELVAKLVDRAMTGGRKEVIWNARDIRGNTVASGIYFYKLTAGEFVQSRKMVLMR